MTTELSEGERSLVGNRLRWCAIVIGIVGATLSIQSQGTPAPILLVVNSGSTNPYGPYLGEILKAEGVNAFSTKQLAAVTSTDLTNSRLVILAETALTSAYQRMPASAHIAISLANLKARQEKPAEMVPFLKDAMRLAGDLNTRRWATSQLEEIERYLADQARVDEENRKQREAYEQQMADYEKKYGKPRKKKAQ